MLSHSPDFEDLVAIFGREHEPVPAEAR
jgi:hypothetical protein